MTAHHCSLFEASAAHADRRPTGPIHLDEVAEVAHVWREVLASRPGVAQLGARGSRTLVLATGPQLAAARAYASLREESQWGATDALPADEPRIWREWDHVVAVTRSGDERELLHALRHLPPRVSRTAVTSAAASPVVPLVDETVVLPESAGRSSVTFETAFLLAARVALGADVVDLPSRLDAVLDADIPLASSTFDHMAFVGSGWTAPLAVRAAQALAGVPWVRAESHALRDVRYGSLDHATERTLVWFFGRTTDDVVDRLARTGAAVESSRRDPLVDYVAVQRMALELLAAA